VSISLCMQPLAGEPRELVRYQLPEPATVLEVPARHQVDRIEYDADRGDLALWLDVATERARPVHVEIAVVSAGDAGPARSRHLGSVDRSGDRVDLYGSYLGVVSDEN
jgi:hypothetical protein